jgi:prephenate dehydratase
MSERVAYLGPEGTFSEEALLAATRAGTIEPVAMPTIRDAVMAVHEGSVERALVPIENSIEGPLTVTLDTLTGEADGVAIVGEMVLAVRHCLVGPPATQLQQIATVLSHPHVPGQCARFLRDRLPDVRIEASSSTAEAVRLAAERNDPSCAAIGTRLAAELYGCEVLCEGIQDREDNETRFVWLARAEASSGGAADVAGGGTSPARKTSLVFWGAGADRSGWLVLCLSEFARRDINLTKIESRPRRERLGHYMFFVDLEGSVDDDAVHDALAGLRPLCEEVRVLGSYAIA